MLPWAGRALTRESAAEAQFVSCALKENACCVQVMRSVVMELEYESEKPLLYVVERYLEGSQPFQKFNNNGERALTRKPTGPRSAMGDCILV